MAGATARPLPSSSSPSATFAHSPDTLPSWHFPGPSSVFHKRERDTTRHRRVGSYTIPVAPALSTERRAQHRRVQSSACFAGALPPLPTTPAASEKSRSPLSRFASYTSVAAMAAGPLTPAKTLASSRPGSKLQDSPFSDYFTDDGRSSHEYGYSVPSPEAQQMLLRLNKLQSQLMRGADGESERETLHIVGTRLDSIELELNTMHSQTRMAPELDDSGLFSEEEEGEDGEEEKEDEAGKSVTPSGLGAQYDGANDDVFGERPTKEQKQAEYDYLLVQAQQVLANVSKAQENLRQRHAELRELNDAHSVDVEEKDKQIEELKSENEAMQLDLAHDHSELLFLKLQFKALEVEFDALDDDGSARPKLAQRKKLQDEMARWRSDWHDVDGRMRSRRRQYGVMSPQSRRGSHAEHADGVRTEDDGWQLETVKKGHGRVQSIVIKRTMSAGYSFGPDGADDVEDQQTLTPTPHSDKESTSTPTAEYADDSTQTDLPHPLDLTNERDFDEGDTPPLEDDDYAITTSSEADDTEYEDYAAQHMTPTMPTKSAWQDLWDGLSSLAGMGEERF